MCSKIRIVHHELIPERKGKEIAYTVNKLVFQREMLLPRPRQMSTGLLEKPSSRSKKAQYDQLLRAW